MKKPIIYLILLLAGTAQPKPVNAQTPLTLSASGINGVTDAELDKSVDKDLSTCYTSSKVAFYLTVTFDRSIQAAKVRIVASEAEFIVKLNGQEYTQTMADDETFYVVDPSSFNALVFSKAAKTEISVCEVEVTEIVLNTVSMPLTYDAAGNNTYRKIVIGSSKAGVLDADTAASRPTYDSIAGQQVAIFPNPTRGQLIIKKSGYGSTGPGSYLVYSATGIEILKGEWAETETPVDLDSQPNGTYILVLYLGNEKLTYKIIKQ